MAAVDAARVWVETEHGPETSGDCAACRSEALRLFAALFTRAGIDGPGTIALTRDDEGRYGLLRKPGGDEGIPCFWVPLVPVEDDEEGGMDDTAAKLVADLCGEADHG